MGENDGVRLVPGEASHGPQIAALVLQTDEAVFAYLWNHRLEEFARVVEAGWRARKSEYSHRFATVAMEGDTVIGVLIGFDAPTYDEQVAATSGIAVPLMDEALIKHMRGVLPMLKYRNPTIPRSAYYVHIVSVSDHAQGKGVGHMLMNQGIDQARRLNCKSVQLDTGKESAAVAFYRRLGFDVLVETRVPQLEEKAGDGARYRMTMALSPETTTAQVGT